MSLALEMLVDHLFGENVAEETAKEPAIQSVASYGLTKSQKEQIKQALHDAIRANVPEGSDYHRDIDAITSRIFWRTAADKTGLMLRQYQISFDETDLRLFIQIRNSVIHGTPTKYGLQDKVKPCSSGRRCSASASSQNSAGPARYSTSARDI